MVFPPRVHFCFLSQVIKHAHHGVRNIHDVKVVRLRKPGEMPSGQIDISDLLA